MSLVNVEECWGILVFDTLRKKQKTETQASEFVLIFCVNRSGLLCWLWFCVGPTCPKRPKPLVHRQVSIFSRQGICPWLCSMDLPWEDGLVWSEVSVLAWHMSIRVYPVKFSRQLRFLCQVSLRNQVLHTLLPSACATPQIHAQNTALCRQNPSTKTNDRHSPMSAECLRWSMVQSWSRAPLLPHQVFNDSDHFCKIPEADAWASTCFSVPRHLITSCCHGITYNIHNIDPSKPAAEVSQT